MRPTKEDLARAVDKTVRDVLAPGLKVVFCGINPGLYTAAVGHHFARPGNRFWPTIYKAGFTPRLYSPFEDQTLPELGIGITNVVARASVAAAELTPAELREGARILDEKMRKFRPRFLAIVGIGAYQTGFDRPKAKMGLQPELIGGATEIWVLPNPSGLNANYRPAELVKVYGELHDAL